jgi:uncharacterized protein
MSAANYVNHVNYIELPAQSPADVMRSKAFYGNVFGWTYKDWGDAYADTQSSGVSTGINGDSDHRPQYPLVVIYADDLESRHASVVNAGGKITRDIFSFPGGRRFHFLDLAGNELAVWSDR